VHLAAAERDDRLSSRQKPGGKVATRSRVVLQAAVALADLAGEERLRRTPAFARERPDAVDSRLPAANCSQFAVAPRRLPRRAVSRCARGPSRVVPGTPSDPSWNTDQGVEHARKSMGIKNPSGAAKAKRAWSGTGVSAQRRPAADSTRVAAAQERVCSDPKGGELCLSRAKPEETLVEARSDPDVQIGRQTWA